MREVLHPRLSIPFVEAEIRLTSRFLREWTDRYASDGCSIFILDIALYSELHFTYACTIRNELSDSENLHLLRILLQFVLNVQKKMERETYSKISMVSRDRKRRNFQFLAAINPRRDVGPGIRRRRGKRKKKNKRAIRERVYPGMAS